jgi:two-component system, response regulator RegA
MTADNKLLIIDDEKSFAETLQRLLVQHGYDVKICLDTKNALLEMRQWQPNYCLLDLKIGSESGLKLIQPLKALKPDLLLIVMTGFASISTVVEAMKLGANNYLAKPIDIHIVLDALENPDANSDALITNDPMSVKRLEWEHIQNVLAKNDGNISATARDLNMHRRTLQRKLVQKPHKR